MNGNFKLLDADKVKIIGNLENPTNKSITIPRKDYEIEAINFNEETIEIKLLRKEESE